MAIAKMDKVESSATAAAEVRAGAAPAAAGFFVSDGTDLHLVSAGGIARLHRGGDVACWQPGVALPPGFDPVAASGAGGRLLFWSATGAAQLFDPAHGFRRCTVPPDHRVLAGALIPDGACLLISAAAGPLRAGIADPGSATAWRDLPDLPPPATAPALFAGAGLLWLTSQGGSAGFLLWSLDAAAEAAVWTLRLPPGAGRGTMNLAVSALCAIADGGALIATLPAPGQPVCGLDHPGSELIALPPGGGWDLVMGEARFSPEGLRLPLSLLGEGFETPDHSWITALAASGDRIVALCRDPLGDAPPVLRLTQPGAALQEWPVLPQPPQPTLIAAVAVGPVAALFTVGTGVALTQGAAVWLIADPAAAR